MMSGRNSRLERLWQSCCDGTRVLQSVIPASVCVRHRDLLYKETGVDADVLVHEVLTRYCGEFLGHGAGWALPRRDEGFYRAILAVSFAELVAKPLDAELARELARLENDAPWSPRFDLRFTRRPRCS